ncbi:type II toxin-antitoxin system HicA family toxin [Arabiibacter massiliensis]|uniref:type II toxin-antitoxin system HicA family toxin n=1 Tax=Arabiibacter massiliensis TaxID=1870985 RepID=UPI0009B9AEBE|nr:type II toxin-antitoxin system HicA family toxin [Arabiibacter massiliensis]
MPKESRDTRKVASRLVQEGWVKRRGKGDHANFSKPGNPRLITLDMGEKEVDKNIYRAIKSIAGWE